MKNLEGRGRVLSQIVSRILYAWIGITPGIAAQVAHSPQKWISSDDYLNDEILTDELADEAISLMKKKLPTYIVNSFIATGYDTLDVIADLTNEDITEIEAIIKHDFVGNDRFVNHATGNTSDMSLFKFQPGHRKRIQKFIKEAK